MTFVLFYLIFSRKLSYWEHLDDSFSYYDRCRFLAFSTHWIVFCGWKNYRSASVKTLGLGYQISLLKITISKVYFKNKRYTNSARVKNLISTVKTATRLTEQNTVQKLPNATNKMHVGSQQKKCETFKGDRNRVELQLLQPALCFKHQNKLHSLQIQVLHLQLRKGNVSCQVKTFLRTKLLARILKCCLISFNMDWAFAIRYGLLGWRP